MNRFSDWSSPITPNGSTMLVAPWLLVTADVDPNEDGLAVEDPLEEVAPVVAAGVAEVVPADAAPPVVAPPGVAAAA